MKIRSDFVTNSSSSSFIVSFNKRPKNVDELMRMMFGSTENGVIEYYDNSVTKRQAAEIVMSDIREQRTKTKKQLIEITQEGWFDGHIDAFNSKYETDETYPGGCKKIDWDQFYKDNNKAAERFVDNFLNGHHTGDKIYTFEYSDESGVGSAMEHGGIFNNMTHRAISKH